MKSEWKRCTIEDIASISAGGDKPRVCSNVRTAETPFPVFSNGLENCGLYGYTNKAKIEGDTITISARGVNVGTVCYRKEPFLPIVRLLSLIPDRKIVNARYLYYLLRNTPLSGTGSAQPQITVPMIKKQEICIHNDIETQKSIAGILSCLDDKIVLNTAINENLSKQIQHMYDNLTDSLIGNPVSLSTIIDVRDGTHDSPKAVENGFPLVTSKHLLPYGVDLSTANLISKKDFDKTNERSIVETHDILISMIGTVGLISLVIEDPVPFAIKNVGLFKTSKYPELYAFILSYLRSTKTTQHIEKTLAGSTQKYISLGELRKMPIILPDEIMLNDYNKVVFPLIMQITNLTEENKRLVELRDTLMPKLMSGEIDVSNLDL